MRRSALISSLLFVSLLACCGGDDAAHLPAADASDIALGDVGPDVDVHDGGSEGPPDRLLFDVDTGDVVPEPDCVDRECGLDPVSGRSCGGCGAGAVCTAAGRCFSPDFVELAGGAVAMGDECEGGEWWCLDERPVHEVEVPPFALARTEVTHREWWAVVGRAHWSYAGCADCPVEWLSWFEAVAYTNALSSLFGVEACYELFLCAGRLDAASFDERLDCGGLLSVSEGCAGYRLPSESEWEFAARSGRSDWSHPWGEATSDCGRVVGEQPGLDGWGCGTDGAWPVCSLAGGLSEQGLCDLLGNVAEWTEDGYRASYGGHPTDGGPWPPLDPLGERSARGGAWTDPLVMLRSSARDPLHPDFAGPTGLRPAIGRLPACAAIECGRDPIWWRDCGVCEGNERCEDGRCVACPADCSAVECGPDPVCGEDCGACPEGQLCRAGSCCSSDCSGRVCGPDPLCGASCGTCGEGELCLPEGACVAVHDEEIDWVALSPGHYAMGKRCPDDWEVCPWPAPVEVTVDGFWMARTEVTGRQWRAVMGTDPPGDHADDDGPVDLSFWEALIFCNALSVGEGLEPCYDIQTAAPDGSFAAGCVTLTSRGRSCAGYRLPSEAEWEYAARSEGREQDYPWGDENPSCALAIMYDVGATNPAWSLPGCGRQGPWPVCSRPEGNSAQGICDLVGNAWEWTEDAWTETDAEPARDGSARLAESRLAPRVLRGGDWQTNRIGSDPTGATAVSPDSGGAPSWTNGVRPVRSREPCPQDCSEAACGPDPNCGVLCGRCAPGDWCEAGLCGACTPDCTETRCGPDPRCGLSCGDCPEGEACRDGRCEACEPVCWGRECGADPDCGLSCGSCPAGEICDGYGVCVDTALRLGLELLRVPAGSFVMGDDASSGGRPAHRVDLPSFYVSRAPISFRQRNCVRRSCGWDAPELPDPGETNLTWWKAAAICNDLSRSAGRSPCYHFVGCESDYETGWTCADAVPHYDECDGFRLPSEAEWAYLARVRPLGDALLGLCDEPGAPAEWLADGGHCSYDGDGDGVVSGLLDHPRRRPALVRGPGRRHANRTGRRRGGLRHAPRDGVRFHARGGPRLPRRSQLRLGLRHARLWSRSRLRLLLRHVSVRRGVRGRALRPLRGELCRAGLRPRSALRHRLRRLRRRTDL